LLPPDFIAQNRRSYMALIEFTIFQWKIRV
jgi:hypothetical protein